VFRIWHEQEDVNFNQRQVELCGNVFLDALLGDMLCITKQGDKNPTTPPDKARTLFTHWRFRHNWRDLSGSQASTVIPLAPDDQKLDTQIFLSRDPNHPDFMRPAPASQLAREGAGHDAFWLPDYAGAMPPKGVAPWDWEMTWNARMRTSREH
jgi:hypothetical protein